MIVEATLVLVRRRQLPVQYALLLLASSYYYGTGTYSSI